MGLLSKTETTQKAGLLNKPSASPSVPEINITANSTPQTSFKVPETVPVTVKQAPKVKEEPVSFPLKGTTISQAKVKEEAPIKKLVNKIKNQTIRDIVTGVIEAPRNFVFGDEQKRQEIKTMEEQGIKVPFSERFVSEGLAPSLGLSQTEIIDKKATDLIRKGTPRDRAYEVASIDTLNKTIPKDLADMQRKEVLDKEYAKLAVTDQEKSTLRFTNAVQSIFAGLDIAGFIPIGATVENIGKNVARIAKSKDAGIIADELVKIGVAKSEADNIAVVLSKTEDPDTIERIITETIKKAPEEKAGLLNRTTSKVDESASVKNPLIDESKILYPPEKIAKYEGFNSLDEYNKFLKENEKNINRPALIDNHIKDLEIIDSGLQEAKRTHLSETSITNLQTGKKNLQDNSRSIKELEKRKAELQQLVARDEYNKQFYNKLIPTNDRATQQELKNSIQEGKNIIKAKSINGRKLSEEELANISKSVESAQAKIGVQEKDGYKLQEISSDTIFNQSKGVTKDMLTKDGLKNWKTLVTRGEAEVKDGKFYRIQPATKVPKNDIVPKDFRSEGEVLVKNDNVVNRRTPEELAQGKQNLSKRMESIPTQPNQTKTERTPEIQDKIDMLKYQKSVLEDTNFQSLTKYESKRGEFKGELNTNNGTGKFASQYDTQLREVFGDIDNKYTTDELKAKYEELKNSYKNITEQIKKLEQTTKISSLKKPVSQFATIPKEVTSVEAKAEEYLSRVPSRYERDVLALPDIVERGVTDVKNKVNVLDYLRTPDRILQKIGFAKEAKAVREGYEAYIKELPKNIDKITEWSKRVPKESNERIFQFLDGKEITLNKEELAVANEIKTWLKEWAKRLDLPEDKQITHYITHIFDRELVKKEFDEELAKIITDRIPSSAYDPFLESRLGKLGYKQNTWEALDAYVKRATRKANMDKALEMINKKAGSTLDMAKIEASQFKYIQRYVNNINLRPTELDNLIDNSLKSVFGYKYGNRPVTYLTRLLRQLTYRGMLGLNPASALRNLSQGVNTYAKLGEKYTALGYLNLFKKGSLNELKEVGVLADSFIQDRSISSTKKAMEKIDKGLWAMFQTAEHINRGSAYFGAKAKALAQGMSEKEAIEAGKKMVRDTQFSFGSIDTPVALQNDIVKTLTQFQSYTVKQIEFLTEMAKNKEFAGLIRYAVGGLAFTYTIGQIFGMKPEQLLPMFRFDTPPSLKLPVEVAKATLDAPDKYGQDRDLEQKMSDIAKSTIGLIPAGNQLKKTIEGLMTIREGGSFDKGGNLQFEAPTTTEGKIQSLLFGKYSTEKAGKYFDKSVQADKDMEVIQPIYDQIQEMKKAGKEEEALALYDSLGEKGKEVYKKVKSKAKAEETKIGKQEILPTFREIRKLKEEGKADEAVQMYESLTDDEKKYYQLLKKQIEKGEPLPEAESSLKKNILKAFGVESASAMEAPTPVDEKVAIPKLYRVS